MSRLAPSCPPAQGSCPHAQGLHPRALGIYVIICDFTLEKVWWGTKNFFKLGSRPRSQGLHPRALGIYVVICHFTFKKVFRIDHTTNPNPQKARL